MSPKIDRKPISKRMRFEVFKRDSFTCQYCGSKSPEVVLEVDHIEPVSKGGKTVMLNLVTSCFKCNRGKRNIKLSDTSVIEKQKKALIELSEKQKQLKMLLKWRSSLLNIEAQELHAAQETWAKLSTCHLTETGIAGLKKLLKEFGLLSVLESMDIATKYLEYEDSKVVYSSVETAFKKLKGVCYIRSLPEDKRKEYQEIGSIKITMKYKYRRDYDDKWVPIYINRFIKSGNSVEKLKEITSNSSNFWNWKENIHKYIQ
jgi:hypothetical protein